jgi:hypothetical protein
VTYGANGWHAHFHCLVVTRKRSQACHCSAALTARYSSQLVRRDWQVTSETADDRHVYDPIGLARYFSRSWHLRPRDGGSTPFMLLKAALKGCAASAALFFELADAFVGRRCVTVSANITHAVYRQ